MQGLKELLAREGKRYIEIKRIVDSRLVDVPKGTLRITTSRNALQYIHCVEDSNKSGYKLSYIRKANASLVKRLAQKSYDQRIKKLVDRRLKQIEKIAGEYEDKEIEEIYDKLSPVRKGLVQAVEEPWEEQLKKWKSIPYIGKEFDAKTPLIYTKKGERVRSKSEKILADTFYALGIEYKYECPIKLNGYGVVYPDFTFLRKRDGKEVYWEHDGKMDDPKYAEKAIRKINSYIANDILPGDKLIVSFESSGVVINDRIIKKMIDTWL